MTKSARARDGERALLRQDGMRYGEIYVENYEFDVVCNIPQGDMPRELGWDKCQEQRSGIHAEPGDDEF